jgi:hypothetical protein
MMDLLREDRLRHLILLLAACLVLAGCSSQLTPITVEKPLDPTHARLLKIGAAYRQFTTSHKEPPKSWADLKPILAKTDNADAPWTSERDGQPLVVCWGANPSKWREWGKTTPVVAYEKQGAGGSRYVLTAVQGSVMELSDEDFRAASFPPGQTPAF